MSDYSFAKNDVDMDNNGNIEFDYDELYLQQDLLEEKLLKMDMKPINFTYDFNRLEDDNTEFRKGFEVLRMMFYLSVMIDAYMLIIATYTAFILSFYPHHMRRNIARMHMSYLKHYYNIFCQYVLHFVEF